MKKKELSEKLDKLAEVAILATVMQNGEYNKWKAEEKKIADEILAEFDRLTARVAELTSKI